MILSTPAPWPDRWARRPHPRFYAIFAGSVLVSGVFLLVTGTGLATPSRAGVVGLVGAAALLIGAAVWCFQFKLRPYFRRTSTVDLVGPALVIRYRSRHGTWMTSAVPVLVTGGLVVAGVGGGLGDSNAVLSGVLTAVAGLFVVAVALLARRRRFGLYLTPHDVALRTWLRTARLGWDEVSRVYASHIPEDSWFVRGGAGPQIEIRAPRVVQPTMPGGGITITAGQLTAAPALAYWVVEHYFHHPEHRYELGTDAAIERLRRGPS